MMGGEDAGADMKEGDVKMSRMKVLTMLGLGVMLAVGGVAREAVAAPQAALQPYTGQVESIKIDHCDLQPGTCAGSLVLAQARGQEVTLAIPAGTTIQRGDERVDLEQLGVGNYVTVQAAAPPSDLQGNGRNWTWGQVDAYERSPINSGSQGGGR
jgi:hypothetical protein